MSFSLDIKQELVKNKNQNQCCDLAELAAILQCAGEISVQKKGFGVVITTQLQNLYEEINYLLEKLYGESAILEIADEYTSTDKIRYEITVPHSVGKQVLQDIGMMSYDENHNLEFKNNISKYVIEDDCCNKAYLKGAFLAIGTTSIVLTETEEINKRQSGYHLEFTLANEELALDLAGVLAQFDIHSKIVKRRESYVVYIKESDMISDLLAIVGANNAVLKLQSEIAIRSVRNKINRQNNCLSSNIEKTVDASLKQIDAIETIEKIIGIEGLPEKLQDAAMLRLANPEESLDELVNLSTTKISKSGLNHRLNKIIAISKELQEQNN